jgi:hypothetical protein
MTEMQKVSKTTVFNSKLHTLYSMWTFKTMASKEQYLRDNGILHTNCLKKITLSPLS